MKQEQRKRAHSDAQIARIMRTLCEWLARHTDARLEILAPDAECESWRAYCGDRSDRKQYAARGVTAVDALAQIATVIGCEVYVAEVSGGS